MPLVETKRTTPTKFDFAIEVLKLWPELSKESVGVLWAHFAVETGEGIYCWNWNLGNYKEPGGDNRRNYVSLRGVWEGFKITDLDGDGDIDEDDKHLLIHRLVNSGLWEIDPSKDHAIAVGPGKVSLIATKGNKATWFKAFESLEDGMDFFMESKFIGKFASAFTHVSFANPELFGRKLGELKYYTASPDVYARSMRKKYDAWMKDDAYEKAEMELRETQKTINAAYEMLIHETKADESEREVIHTSIYFPVGGRDCDGEDK